MGRAWQAISWGASNPLYRRSLWGCPVPWVVSDTAGPALGWQAPPFLGLTVLRQID